VGKRLVLVDLFVLFGNDSFRRGGLIDEVALPFVGVAVVLDWRIERCIAAQATIHVNILLVRNIEALCNQRDLIGVWITAAFQCGDLAFHRA
jgi:hypothetical protein